jgi:16S rRNA (guanine527-N7)-methyltransferase
MIADALTSLSLASGLSVKLNDFKVLFAKWNQAINLSSATSASEIEQHLIDSLHVVPHLPTSGRILDVGSGGGFPVVVAAICLPGAAFTALEPIHKKHAFLRTAARELALPNLTPLAERLEDHATRDYDAATSRATMDLGDWLLRGRDYVRPGGCVLGFEAAVRTDLPDAVERHPYELDHKQRAIVIVRC